MIVWAFIRANWKPIAVALIVGAFALWFHHSGYKSGMAKGAAQVVTIRHQLEAANANANNWAQAVADMQTAKAQRDSQDAVVAAQNADALQVHLKAAKAAQAALTAAQARLRKALQGSRCALETLPEGAL